MPITVALLSWASVAHCNDLLKLTPGVATALRVAGAEKGKFTAIIGDPSIADLTFGPQNTFLFIGKKDGITNIIVLNDSDGTEIYTARIEVGAAEMGLSKIHNKALLTSYTLYKCSTDDCNYVKEVTSTDSARLPIGYSSVQSNTSIQSNANIDSSTNVQSPHQSSTSQSAARQ